MTVQQTDKTFELNTSWKNHIVGYILSVLAIPLLGVGLITLYWVYKRHKRYSYTVSDTQITSEDSKFHRTVDLIDIDKVSVSQSWLQRRIDIGDVVLHTSALEITLYGMDKPLQLKELLEQAIAAEQQRQATEEKTQRREPDCDPGTMDKMDYLTGLWQQGLVSNEDFEKERKHLE